MTTSIAEYTKTEAALSDLATRYKNVVFDCTHSAGMTDAKKARSEIRGYRVQLEKTRVLIKEPALKHCQMIDSEARRITAALTELEEPIDCFIKSEESRKEAERVAEEQIIINQRLEAERLVKEAEEQKMAAERAEIARRQAELDKAENMRLESERAARMKIEEEQRAARLKIEEEERKARAAMEEESRQARLAQQARDDVARQKREEADRTARLAREAEEARLKAERDKVEAERRELEAKQRAEREAEEAKQREIQRKQNEILDGWAMLNTFVKRFGELPEFQAVAKQIKTHLPK